MNRFLILIFFIPFLSCNEKKDRIKIEKFVWIMHNHGWTSDTSALLAKRFMQYDEENSEIYYAATINSKKRFYTAVASEEFKNKIHNFLYNKIHSECICDNEYKEPMIDGGSFFCCIIYKLENQSESIINYDPLGISSELLELHNYLNKEITYREEFVKSNPFDISSDLKMYRKQINHCFPLPPTPLLEMEMKKI